MNEYVKSWNSERGDGEEVNTVEDAESFNFSSGIETINVKK
jgi:hypothetical protein